MGRLASCLVVVSAVGFIGLAAACAGSGVDEDLPAGDKSGTLPGDGGVDAGPSKVITAPSKDGGKEEPKGDDDDSTNGDDDDDWLPLDGGPPPPPVDAGPPPPPDPVPGETCTTLDEVRKARCGFCGTHEAVCERGRDGTSLHWSGFSPCAGESGECAAGDTRSEECNNCGTRTITCSNSCKWTTGTCSAAVNTGCSPATYDITNAGCNGANLGLYRVRQCKATCDYDSYSTCSAPPTLIEVGKTVGAVSSTVAQLGGSISKITATSCPASISALAAPYAYTQIHNPLPTEATVIIYNSLAPGGKVFETAIAVYNGDNAPATVEARKACVKASNAGNATFSGDTKFASLDTTARKVTIPADGTVTVYTTAEAAADSGPVRVNVKTDSIAKPAP